MSRLSRKLSRSLSNRQPDTTPTNTISLEFEKPIIELKENLKKLLDVKTDDDKDLEKVIKDYEIKIKEETERIYSNISPWEKILVARHPSRPKTLDYIDALTEGRFAEFHGDRNYGDDKSIIGGFGLIEGKTYMIIGQEKGKDTKTRNFHNFGMSNPEGYRKALRLMRLAEKFQKPIITLIDTPGAYPGIEAEERGQGEAIARNIYEMIGLKTPILNFIIGEGASGGALGIGVGDKLFMLEFAWYSVISPESCSSILWKSWDNKELAAKNLKLTSEDMLKLKLIYGIIKEPIGGAHSDPIKTINNVKEVIIKEIELLEKIDAQTRINNRIKKYDSMGIFEER